MKLSILLVGDADRREFRDARDDLVARGRVVRAADARGAESLLAAGQFAPDVVVVAQTWPGEFSPASVDALRRLAPLARIVGLLGSWCEGEVRTGRPWPAAVRVYWHQWPARAARELSHLADGRGSAWGLPFTATEEERLLAVADAPVPRGQGLVAIYSDVAEMADWIAAACRGAGWATAWLRPPRPAPVRGAAAAVFDGADGGGGQLEELRRLAAALAPAPVVALADFPRVEDRDRALAAGATAVLSKPLRVEDLLWRLGRCAADSVAGTRRVP